MRCEVSIVWASRLFGFQGLVAGLPLHLVAGDGRVLVRWRGPTDRELAVAAGQHQAGGRTGDGGTFAPVALKIIRAGSGRRGMTGSRCASGGICHGAGCRRGCGMRRGGCRAGVAAG